MRYALLATALLAAAGAAHAQDGSMPKIPNDGSPAHIQGTVAGYEQNRYNVTTEEGETLRVDLKADHDKCFFNITAQGSTQLLYWSGKGGPSYAGSPGAPGTYVVKVFLDKNSAKKRRVCNYDLSLALPKGEMAPMTAPQPPR